MAKNKLSKATKLSVRLEGYDYLLRDIKSIIEKAKAKAYQAVDNIKVQTYWQIGERVVREEFAHKERADYGKYLVDNLSVDLSIGKRELYRIIRFYRFYEIVTTVSSQLSWSHYIELININDNNERVFYQNKTILHSWSVQELRKLIKNKLYQKTSPNEIHYIDLVLYHRGIPHSHQAKDIRMMKYEKFQKTNHKFQINSNSQNSKF